MHYSFEQVVCSRFSLSDDDEACRSWALCSKKRKKKYDTVYDNITSEFNHILKSIGSKVQHRHRSYFDLISRNSSMSIFHVSCVSYDFEYDSIKKDDFLNC